MSVVIFIFINNLPAQEFNKATGCNPSTSKTYLDINNARTKILISGGMWWDLSNNLYEIPKGSGINSIYCGAIWIGGLDAGGQLKITAMTYRQSGNDFWPGPINQQTVDVDPAALGEKILKAINNSERKISLCRLLNYFSRIYLSLLRLLIPS